MEHLRYAMTPVPIAGTDSGADAEAQAQWFFELAFFRDVVLRNPRGKGGKGGRGELADAVVLHGDVALMVQVKAQSSPRPPREWAKKAIADALDQLRHTHRMLAQGHVRTLTSELLGKLAVDATKYRNRWGLIILDQPVDPFEPITLVPEISEVPFPVQVYSLVDLEMLTERFDTAGDLINYFEIRECFRTRLQARVHEESRTLPQVLDAAPEYFRHFRPDLPAEMAARTVEMIRRTASGEFQRPPLVGYGQAYDDLIARLHEPDDPAAVPADALPIIEELGWLTRNRRVALGQIIAARCEQARDGTDRWFCHYQRQRGIVFVYLVTSLPRQERVAMLEALTLRAQSRYDCAASLGVATEPLGAGRSYDAVLHRAPLAPAVLEHWRAIEDPFGDEAGQLLDSI